MNNGKTALERYERQTDRTTDPNGCHLWTGTRSRDGYGKILAHRKHWLAHRFGWTQYVGQIPEGLVVRHFICDNPPCQNIDHLMLGTVYDNNHDMLRKGRYRGWQGHRWTSENSPNAKLTPDAVRCIRSSYIQGLVTFSDLADEFGVSRLTISRVISRESWANLD